MPNPRDLTGQRWGRLVAVEKAPDIVSASGKTRYAAWLCRCDCGREQVFPTQRLPYTKTNAARKDAASECDYCKHQRTCAVCGKVFQSVLYRATCGSQECAVLQRRANDMKHYYRQMAQDPDYNRKIRAQKKARAEVDPEYAERLREQWRLQEQRKMARISADPQRLARYNAMSRERYHGDHAANRERINARRHERIESMPEAEYQVWLESRRAAFRRYARKVRGTPEGREKYRQYMSEFRAQQALRKLFAVGQEVTRRGNQK